MRWFVMSMLMMTVTAAHAGDDAQMTAKYRSMMMRGVGAHMGQIGLVMKGQIDRKDDLLDNAKAIQSASTKFMALFPDGTGPDQVKTEALPAIWKDGKRFEEANKKWQETADALVKTLEKKDASMEDIKAAWGAMGKTCGGCHDSFKKDD